MSTLSAEVRDAADRSVLCWLATVGQDGRPNVSPKEIWAILESDHVVVANIASPTTVRNIRHSGHVCLSFIDVFVQKGFKVIGEAENIERGHPSFQDWAAPLLSKAEPRFKVHSVIVVRHTLAEPIVAPSYRLYPSETTEESQIASAHRTYGLAPRPGGP
jgi:predicted pyridoxine 5'-phosphate oxidase superfamily flavin-nucleotide-binding protein